MAADRIEQLAREAGMDDAVISNYQGQFRFVHRSALAHFARLVEADALERAEKLCLAEAREQLCRLELNSNESLMRCAKRLRALIEKPIPSSGNVFDDLGFVDAEQMKAMADQIVCLERERDALRDALRELVKWTEQTTDTRICPVSLLRAMNRARALLDGGKG